MQPYSTASLLTCSCETPTLYVQALLKVAVIGSVAPGPIHHHHPPCYTSLADLTSNFPQIISQMAFTNARLHYTPDMKLSVI